MKRLIKYLLLKGVRRNKKRIVDWINKRLNIPRMPEADEEVLFSELFDIILG